MKTWYLIDDCIKSKGQVFEKNLHTQSKEEALDYAKREWEALSEHDQRGRDEFYIILADDSGCDVPDYDTSADSISIK